MPRMTRMLLIWQVTWIDILPRGVPTGYIQPCAVCVVVCAPVPPQEIQSVLAPDPYSPFP